MVLVYYWPCRFRSLGQLKEIADRVEGLLGIESGGTDDKTPAGIDYRATRLAAAVSRQRWAEKVRATTGTELTQKSTSVYETPEHIRIGVGFGNPSSKHEGRWFLSLTDEPFDFIVFICRNADGTDSDFVIPRLAFGDSWQ